MTSKAQRASELSREIDRLNCAISRLNRMHADVVEQLHFEAERADSAAAEARYLARTINVLATVWDGTRVPNCIIANMAFAELEKAKGAK